MGYVGGSTSVDRAGGPGDVGANQPPAYQPGGQYYGATQQGGYNSLGMGTMPLADVTGQLQGILGSMQPALDLANASADQQIGLLGQQGQLADLMAGKQSQSAIQEEGWGERGIGLSREQLGIQQGALARQMSLLPQMYDLQKQGFDITQRSEQQAADLNAYRLNNQAAAAGAYTAAGTNVERTGLQQNLQNQFGQLNLQRQDAALTFQERQAQQQDAQKQLGVAAKRLDLSEEELRGRLQNTLEQIGIGRQVSVDQLMAEAVKVNEGRYSPISSLISFIMNQANLPILTPK